MISIIVPYRDRDEHLSLFFRAIAKMPQRHEVVIVEQQQGKPFNRGKLLNVGASIANGDFFIFHDVDMIPRFSHYPLVGNVIQYAKSDIQQIGYLGGVTGFKRGAFITVDGYSNNFWSRAEDNEMAFNLSRKGMRVRNEFLPFKMLSHARPAVEFDPQLWAKAQLPRMANDGFKRTKYKILEETNEESLRWVRVAI